MTKLLLVEDDEDSVELVQTAISMANLPIELNVAYDGEEAWNYLQEKGERNGNSLPELMVLDLNLPKKNGRELLSDMKKLPSLRSMPVILLTTTEWHDDLKREFPMLQSQCYSKPMRFQDYMDMLREIQNRLMKGELKGMETGG